MKLQNVLFPSTDTCTEDNMYFRCNGNVDFTLSSGRIGMKKGSKVDFDTYFNSFSAEKWKKYTSVQTVYLTVKIKGRVRITLLRKEKAGSNILTEYIGEYLCRPEGEEEQEFTFPLGNLSGNGIYCFSLAGVKGKSYFYGGWYSADIPPANLNHVKIAIGICTFRREEFVKKNLKRLNGCFLQNQSSELSGRLEVFISDNAKTLDIDAFSSGKIHIFPNKNVGGAGGFTRGLLEIKQAGGFTHVLLMDDDILIEPESVFRTYALLRCLKEQYKSAFIGGAMLRLDRRSIQVESGAMWNSGSIVSMKHGLDLNDLTACLYNEMEENVQFNAWWYCVFPTDMIREDNLPMPLFVRGDDVEYGLRNMQQLILMNGICVWHEPFENKYSSYLFYYIWRNRLIDNAIHNMVIPKEQFAEILKDQVMEQIMLYRYKNAHLLMQGVEDFLKGVSWFKEQDGEMLHKEIVNQGYKLQYIEDLDEKVQFAYHIYEDSAQAENPTTIKYRLLKKYTFNGIFHLPTSGRRPFNIIPAEGAKFISVYRTDKVLNYDFASRRGFLTYKNPSEAKQAIHRLKELCKRLKYEYQKASDDFAKNGRLLMTERFWNEYLELEKCEKKQHKQ